MNFITADSRVWLREQLDASLPSIVTGIPDMDEVNMTDVDSYCAFVQEIAWLCFQKVLPNGYVIFIQTDRKVGGKWLDKAFLIQNVTSAPKLLFHKIIVRSFGTQIQRPAFSHILCFSHSNGTGGGRFSFPDVIQKGQVLWNNGTSIEALEHIMQFLKGRGIESILDPFCGHGTIAIVAKRYGIECQCIDIDPSMIQRTQENLNAMLV